MPDGFNFVSGVSTRNPHYLLRYNFFSYAFKLFYIKRDFLGLWWLSFNRIIIIIKYFRSFTQYNTLKYKFDEDFMIFFNKREILI